MRLVARMAVGLLMLALAGEAVLRWGVGLGDPPLARLDGETEYELVPGQEYRRWGNRVAINAWGMRAPDHAALPARDERRVLLIGDSVVYGNHFLDQAETLAARLTGDLAADPHLAGCRPRVLPMAVSSWGPVNQAAFLARMGPFGAEAAGIVISAHDLFDVPRPATDILPYRLQAPYGALHDAVLAVIERRRRAANPPDPRPRAARRAESLAALGAMVDDLRGQGLEPWLIYHPTLPERRGRAAAERQVFAEWARARGVRFLDLGAAISGTGGYRDVIHPDADGAARMARALAPVLAGDLAPCGG